METIYQFIINYWHFAIIATVIFLGFKHFKPGVRNVSIVKGDNNIVFQSDGVTKKSK